MQILTPLQQNVKLQSKLSKLNLHTWWDLALHIPLRYEDLTKIYPINEIQPGQQVQIQGSIIGHEIVHKKQRQLLVRVDDGSAIISLLFFHFYPSYASYYATGKQILAHGEVKRDFYGNLTMMHPKVQVLTPETKVSNTFSPVYPATQGLAQAEITSLVEKLFTSQEIPETLAPEIRQKFKLPALAQALLTLHKLTPQQFASKEHENALRRLKYDELIAQQLLMHKVYARKHHQPAPKLTIPLAAVQNMLEQLPFKLTPAQQRVLHEILADIAKAQQMNRLLQGDVGSGKTIIATLSCLVAINNGYQAVIMAPTEILAEQHYIKACKLLAESTIQVNCLSGSLSAKNKRKSVEACANGSAQLIIGTHAVFQKQIEFKSLGLVVIDEQHRFGVEQRLALVNKTNSALYPHQLMMSATPIPRSLVMSYYADLDVSIIDQLPPGRTPVKTILIKTSRRQEVINYVSKYIGLGQQVYWVCPLIEESEKLELENAINTYSELSIALPLVKIGLIHGKLKAAEKATVMDEFSKQQLQLLVATTVIEVGVDVPNATIMVIEHSERMGLAQLHQLRGRVGRGSIESQCILLYEAQLSEIAKQRLKVIANSTDGFAIARADLLIRGPGELLGQRQSGLPALRFANLEADLEILHHAREIAQQLATNYPQVAQILLELWFHDKQIYAGI